MLVTVTDIALCIVALDLWPCHGHITEVYLSFHEVGKDQTDGSGLALMTVNQDRAAPASGLIYECVGLLEVRCNVYFFLITYGAPQTPANNVNYFDIAEVCNVKHGGRGN